MAELKTAKKERSTGRSRIKELEEELSTTKYNKRTQGHIGLVKAKIARLKEDQQRKQAGKGKSEGYTVKRSGDGTAIIVGFPSVGKSTLLNALTNAKSQVAAYAFTTLTCIPGLLEYKHAKIQILDVPGIVEGAATGRGRGKEVLACARSADLVLILLDVFSANHLDVIKKELNETGLIINQLPADVKIIKDSRGGIKIGTTVKLTRIEKETIEAILKEFRINNCTIIIREDIDADQLIDSIEGNKKYVPAIVAVNKMDMATPEQIEKIKKIIKPDLFISADKKINIEQLKDMMFRKLSFMRVYCKEANKKADMNIPVIIQEGATLRDLCIKLHRDFVSKFKFARVWGKSVKFDGMILRNLKHKLSDEDIVEIHLR